MGEGVMRGDAGWTWYRVVGDLGSDEVPPLVVLHAQVLVCIARDPGIRLREIGERVGITERAAHRIVVELADAGYIARERNGRRNHYTINAHFPLHEPIVREQNVGELASDPHRAAGDQPAERSLANERMIDAAIAIPQRAAT